MEHARGTRFAALLRKHSSLLLIHLPIGVDGFSLLAEALTGTHGKTVGVVDRHFSLTEHTCHLTLVLLLSEEEVRRHHALLARYEMHVGTCGLQRHLVVMRPLPIAGFGDIGEMHRHLHLLLALAVFAFAS